MVTIKDFTNQELINAIAKWLNEESILEDNKFISFIYNDIADRLKSNEWLENINDKLKKENK
jgi:hypothetical protein